MSSSGYTRSNGSVVFENNNHEEADTLMINHAVLSSRRSLANARIVIFSPDIPCYSCCRPSYPHSECARLRKTSVSIVSAVNDVEAIARAIGQLRVHVQARRCNNMTLSLLHNGFYKDASGDLVSHATDDLPAPMAIIEIVNCQCKGSCSSQRYGCSLH